jgi:hypothetical protein
MRLFFTWIAVVSFALIGVCALFEREWLVAVATLNLSVANGIFLILLA